MQGQVPCPQVTPGLHSCVEQPGARQVTACSSPVATGQLCRCNACIGISCMGECPPEAAGQSHCLSSSIQPASRLMHGALPLDRWASLSSHGHPHNTPCGRQFQACIQHAMH